MSNILQFPNGQDSSISDEELQEYMDLILDKNSPGETEVMNMTEIICPIEDLKTVPNIETGGDPRNHRWGALFNVGVLPDLDKRPAGSVTLPRTPNTFISGDNLEELEERLIYEVKKSVRLARLMKENPQAYRALTQRLSQAMQDEAN